MNKVNLPGFRPGKVPKTIIKKRFGQNVVSEVLDKIINETLTNAVKEKKLKPSVQPKVEIKKYEEGNDLQFSASFQLMPDIPDFDLKRNIITNRINHIQKQFKEHINISEEVVSFIASEKSSIAP